MKNNCSYIWRVPIHLSKFALVNVTLNKEGYKIYISHGRKNNDFKLLGRSGIVTCLCYKLTTAI